MRSRWARSSGCALWKADQMPRQRIHHTRETYGYPDDFPERLVRLESAAEGARAILSQRRAVLDDVRTITAYAQDMNRFL